MIPKNSTPIKNEILIDIFAKGLLNKDEMRIVFYIIRWSWGFNGKIRRQDWTKKLTKRKIADDINLDRGKCCYILNKMINENKVVVNNKCYQFNEHYEDWKKLTKRQSLQDKKVDETSIKNRQKVNQKLIKSQPKVDETSISIDSKPLQDKRLPDRKETLKETKKKTKQKDVVVSSLNNKEKEKDHLITELKTIGINQVRIKDILIEYDLDYINGKIRMLDNREIENPAGWLLNALKDNYKEPKRDNEEYNIPKYKPEPGEKETEEERKARYKKSAKRMADLKRELKEKKERKNDKKG